MRLLLAYVFFTGVALLAASCTERECTNLDNPRLNIVFKTRRDSTRQRPEKDTTLQLVTLKGIGREGSLLAGAIPGTVTGTGANQATNAVSIILPLNQSADSSSFEMEWNEFTPFSTEVPPIPRTLTGRKVKATFTVRYTRQPFFLSENCGFDIKFRDLTIETSGFSFTKPVEVIKNVADEANTPNVKIYF